MRILFVDDHKLVRDALTHFLCGSSPDTEVVGVGDVAAAVEHAGARAFDLILLDYKLPNLSGSNAILAMRQYYPDTPIILLSGAITLDEANSSLELGIAGVISKAIEGKDLWNTINDHLTGTRSVSKLIPDQAFRNGATDLTKREQQIARLLVAGLRNKEIASEVQLAEITVRLHIRQIFRKINARTRTEAVRILVEFNGP